MADASGVEGPEIFDSRWDGATIPADHWHFHRQLLNRYGVVLAPGEFSQIVKDIRDGCAMLVKRRRTGRGAIYFVRIRSARRKVYVLAVGTRLLTAWPHDPRLNALRRQLKAAASCESGLPPSTLESSSGNAGHCPAGREVRPARLPLVR